MITEEQKREPLLEMDAKFSNDRGLKQAITAMDEKACQFSTGSFEYCQSTIVRLTLGDR